MRSKHFETNTIHAGKIHDQQFGALSTPIYQTSTFCFDSTQQGGDRFSGEQSGYIYGRLGNPTVTELEQRMAVLELTEAAAAFGSGMGAVSASVFAFVKAGDHMIASDALYGCTYSLFAHQCKDFGIDVTFVDCTDEQAVRNAFKSNTKLLYVETPINPNMVCVDLQMIARLAKEHQVKTLVDNTFMSPVLQQPAKHGIDLVLHSATKYLNGHGDVVAGVVCGSQDDIEVIKMRTLKDMGAVISPNDAWLIIRGLKTLALRVEKHCQNAQTVAEYLNQNLYVKTIYYPGLPFHSGHKLLGKQMKGPGGVIAFELIGELADASRFMDELNMCKRAVSLGDAETLIQHPASMTHSTYEPEVRQAAGISDTLVRLSVGLEHPDDIIADLQQALSKAFDAYKKTA